LGRIEARGLDNASNEETRRFEERVERYDYTRSEVGDHLGMHYSAINKSLSSPNAKTWPSGLAGAESSA
jgi:hypothetical protein